MLAIDESPNQVNQRKRNEQNDDRGAQKLPANDDEGHHDS
jgi:hypothetical protein